MLFTSCYVLLLVTTLIVNCILGICIKYIIYPYLIQNIARMFDCEHFVYTYASLMHVCVLMYYAIFCWWCIRMRNCKNSIVSDWISFRLCRLLVIDHARSVLHIYTHTHTWTTAISNPNPLSRLIQKKNENKKKTQLPRLLN